MLATLLFVSAAGLSRRPRAAGRSRSRDARPRGLARHGGAPARVHGPRPAPPRAVRRMDRRRPPRQSRPVHPVRRAGGGAHPVAPLRDPSSHVDGGGPHDAGRRPPWRVCRHPPSWLGRLPHHDPVPAGDRGARLLGRAPPRPPLLGAPGLVRLRRLRRVGAGGGRRRQIASCCPRWPSASSSSRCSRAPRAPLCSRCSARSM